MSETITPPPLLPQLRRLPQRLLSLIAAAQLIPLGAEIYQARGAGMASVVTVAGFAVTAVVTVNAWRGQATWRSGIVLTLLSLAAIITEGTNHPGTGADASAAFAFAALAAITFAMTLGLGPALGAAAGVLGVYVLLSAAIDPAQVRSAFDESVLIAPAVMVLAGATWIIAAGTRQADRARAEAMSADEDEARAVSRIRAGRAAQRDLHDVTIPALMSVALGGVPDPAAVRRSCAEAAAAIAVDRDPS